MNSSTQVKIRKCPSNFSGFFFTLGWHLCFWKLTTWTFHTCFRWVSAPTVLNSRPPKNCLNPQKKCNLNFTLSLLNLEHNPPRELVFHYQENVQEFCSLSGKIRILTMFFFSRAQMPRERVCKRSPPGIAVWEYLGRNTTSSSSINSANRNKNH